MPRSEERPLLIDAGPVRANGVQKFVGVVVSSEVVDIAPRVSGVIQKVNVNSGDVVSQGQVLVEMDPLQFQGEWRAAGAFTDAAAANLRQARVDLEAAKQLLLTESDAFAQGVSSQRSLDDARFAEKRAEAALQQAEAGQAAEATRLQLARAQVADAKLRCPIAGTVVARYKDAGNRVEANAPILRIASNHGARVRFAFPAREAQSFVVGVKVMVEVEAAVLAHRAVVVQVSPSLDLSSGLVIAEAELSEGDGNGLVMLGLPAWVLPMQDAGASLR